MKCYACDCILTPKESRLKFNSGAFTDLCTKCLGTIIEDVDIDEESESEDEDGEET